MCFSTTYKVSAPERDYADETRRTLEAQIALAPRLYDVESRYQPLYADLALRNLNLLLGGRGRAGQQPVGILELMQQQARASRVGDVEDIEQYGRRAAEAMLGANPYMKNLLDALNEGVMAGVRNPYGLTDEQQRMLAQASRAAMGARGLAGSAIGIADEVARQLVASERLARERLGAGMQMAGLNQALLGDPWMQILGRPSGAVSAAQQLYGQAGPSLFQPESMYAGNLYAANQALNTRARTSGIGQFADLIGGIGSLARGLAAFPWG